MRVLTSSLKVIGPQPLLGHRGRFRPDTAPARALDQPEQRTGCPPAAGERGESRLLAAEHPIRDPEEPSLLWCREPHDGAQCVGRPGSQQAPEFEPFKTFTQDNLLNDETEKVLPKEVLAKIGMTLDQIGGLLTPIGVRLIFAMLPIPALDEFRKLATEALNTPNRYMIVNYLRRTIGQERGGHISPVAAYDADTDRFLVLDVSRYKYPPVWVEADDLYSRL